MDLDILRTEMAFEQERRARLATIPTQVTSLAQQYLASGGEQATITQAVADATP